MLYLVEISCVIAELWFSHLILGSILSAKKCPLWTRLTAYTLTGIALLSLSFLIQNSFVRLGISFLILWALAAATFKGNTIKYFIGSLLICVVVALSDIFTSTLLLWLNFDTIALMQNGSARSLYMIASHLLMLAMSLCISLCRRKNRMAAPLRIIVPIAPGWIASLLLCLVLAREILVHQRDVSAIFLVVLVGLLYTDIVIIYYINQLAEQEQHRLQQTIAEHHYIMQQEYYDQFRIQQEETRALWHDISKLLKAAELDSHTETLQQVQTMLDSIPCVVDVDNRVVSVILNEYLANTRQQNIRLKMDVNIPPELFVTAVDLYVILGNTIDNAIDACLSLPEDKREISLRLKTHNNILFYEITNPYSSEHLHRVRSKEHGFGLRNLERCVEKYNGTVEINQKDGYFNLKAHLNSI